VAFAQGLAGHAGAAIDISDGLWTDLIKLADASKIAADIGLDRVPLSEAAAAWAGRDTQRRWQLGTFGDDYQLLFTAAPDRAERIHALASAHSVEVTRIGRVERGSGLRVDGRAISSPSGLGFLHRLG
jgi:thiamine-monophosphate kinase